MVIATVAELVLKTFYVLAAALHARLMEPSELLPRSVKNSFCMILDTKIEGVDIPLVFKKLEL